MSCSTKKLTSTVAILAVFQMIVGCGESANSEQTAQLSLINVSLPHERIELTLQQTTSTSENDERQTLPYGKLVGPISLASTTWKLSAIKQSPLPASSASYGIAKNDHYLFVLHGFNRSANFVNPSEAPDLWTTSAWEEARSTLGGIDETLQQRRLLQQSLLRIPKVDPDDPPRLRIVMLSPDAEAVVGVLHDPQGNEISSKTLAYPQSSDWLKPVAGELHLEVRYASSPVLFASGNITTPLGSVTTVLVAAGPDDETAGGIVLVHQQTQNGTQLNHLGS